MKLEFLSWLVPSIVSVVGFVLTYILTHKNLKNEIEKTKNTIAIDKLQNAANILFNNHSNQLSTQEKAKRYIQVYNDLILYGSGNLSKIAIDYQKNQYRREEVVFYNALLCSQLKYETTGYYINPIEFLKITIRDYDKFYKDKEVKIIINKIIKERGYSKRLKCK